MFHTRVSDMYNQTAKHDKFHECQTSLETYFVGGIRINRYSSGTCMSARSQYTGPCGLIWGRRILTPFSINSEEVRSAIRSLIFQPTALPLIGGWRWAEGAKSPKLVYRVYNVEIPRSNLMAKCPNPSTPGAMAAMGYSEDSFLRGCDEG